MQASFTVRAARSEDRSQLVALMEALQETEQMLCANRSPRSIGDAHLRYLETVAAAQQGQISVAESTAGLLGFVVCFVEQLDPGDLHVVEPERTYGYVSDLYVVPSRRQHGVGAALMQAAEQHFLQLGLSVVRVGLLYANEPAARFYQKTGYQPYEVLYEKRIDRSG